MEESDYIEISPIIDVEPDSEVDFPFIRAVKYVLAR